MHIIRVLIITLLLTLTGSTPVLAQQGCCSWHGGISHCDASVGRYVCQEGTYSPSCGCYRAPAVEGATSRVSAGDDDTAELSQLRYVNAQQQDEITRLKSELQDWNRYADAVEEDRQKTQAMEWFAFVLTVGASGTLGYVIRVWQGKK